MVGDRLPKGISVAIVPMLTVFYCLVLSALVFHDTLLSASVDVVHHLQLVDAFRTAWTLPQGSEAYLNEMSIYPKLGHKIAALWTRLGSTSLNALVVTAYAAAAVTWLCLLSVLRRVSPPALIAGLILTLILATQAQMLIGQEVVGNFFYAQLVAEAVFVGAGLIGAGLVGRRPVAFLVFSVAAMAVCGEVHQLAALKLALALSALAGLQAWRELQDRSKVTAATALALIAPPVALVANPHFQAMAKIAGNNGGIDLGFPITPWALAAAALVLLGLGVAFVVPRLRRGADAIEPIGPIEILAILGMATAGAALLQVLAWVLGAGSDYAVLKHTYGVATLLVLLVSATLGLVWHRWIVEGVGDYRVLTLLVLVIGHGLVVRAFYAQKSVVDVAGASSLMAKVAVMPPWTPQSRVYFLSSSQPGLINYMVTTVVLHAPRDALTLANLYAPLPTENPQAAPALALAQILTPSGDGAYDLAPCRQGLGTGPFVRVSGQCLLTQSDVRKGIVAGPLVLYKAGASGGAYLTQGWSEPEIGGTWSMAKQAKVVLPLDRTDRRPTKLRLQLFAFLPDPAATRTAQISIANGPPVTVNFDQAHSWRLLELDIPAPDPRASTLAIDIQIPDAISPAALGLSPDARQLGVGIESTQIIYGDAR